jgi:hypothetical protein
MIANPEDPQKQKSRRQRRGPGLGTTALTAGDII